MLAKLLEYQNVDKDLKKLEMQLAASSERKNMLGAKTFIMESEEHVKMIDGRARELLSLYEKTKERFAALDAGIKEYEETAATLKSSDEISYLEKKLQKESDEVKNLEKDLAAITKDMEGVAKAFNEFKDKYSLARTRYLENKNKYDEQKAVMNQKFEPLKKKLESIAKGIDASLLAKYNKKRIDDKIFPVIVPARDNMCGGCSVEFSLQEMDKLKSTGTIECENCGRIIYQP